MNFNSIVMVLSNVRTTNYSFGRGSGWIHIYLTIFQDKLQINQRFKLNKTHKYWMEEMNKFSCNLGTRKAFLTITKNTETIEENIDKFRLRKIF